MSPDLGKLSAERKHNDSRDLPEGMMLVESFDLVNGGYQYSVTGPEAPKRCHFAHFKTREAAILNALVAFDAPRNPTP